MDIECTDVDNKSLVDNTTHEKKLQDDKWGLHHHNSVTSHRASLLCRVHVECSRQCFLWRSIGFQHSLSVITLLGDFFPPHSGSLWNSLGEVEQWRPSSKGTFIRALASLLVQAFWWYDGIWFKSASLRLTCSHVIPRLVLHLVKNATQRYLKPTWLCFLMIVLSGCRRSFWTSHHVTNPSDVVIIGHVAPLKTFVVQMLAYGDELMMRITLLETKKHSQTEVVSTTLLVNNLGRS